MASLETDRRTTIIGLITLATGTVSAGCLSGFREPESDVTIEIEGEDEAATDSVDGLTFGSDDAPCGIVFVPQINMDRTSWTTQAEALTGDDRFAEASDDVDGLVALSPGGGTEHASNISARSLFVVAEDDDERFVETTQALHENAPEPTRLEVLPGDDHGQRLFETDRGDELEDWIDELVDTACREGQ